MPRPLVRMKMLRPEEVLHSYLTGLAPVGETIEISRKTLMEDLGLQYTVYYYRLLNKLINLRAVRRLSVGASQKTGLLVVLQRPEQVF